MKKYVFFLAAFLCALGIGLFWFGGFIENLTETSHAAGKAECEVAFMKSQVKQSEIKQEVQIVQTRKEAVVWSRPNSRLPKLIERMRTNGIGTTGDNSKDSGVSHGRK